MFILPPQSLRSLLKTILGYSPGGGTESSEFTEFIKTILGYSPGGGGHSSEHTVPMHESKRKKAGVNGCEKRSIWRDGHVTHI